MCVAHRESEDPGSPGSAPPMTEDNHSDKTPGRIGTSRSASTNDNAYRRKTASIRQAQYREPWYSSGATKDRWATMQAAIW